MYGLVSCAERTFHNCCKESILRSSVEKKCYRNRNPLLTSFTTEDTFSCTLVCRNTDINEHHEYEGHKYLRRTQDLKAKIFRNV